ncbi:MAG: DUF2255 family protein [Myxococcota bacterium]
MSKIPGAALALLLAISALSAGTARGASPTPADEIRVITCGPDGENHERIVWWAELDGTIYVRTTPLATWGRNARREGTARLRFEDRETPVAVRIVEAPSALERIHAAFRAKYGGRDVRADLLRWLVGGKITFETTALDDARAADCAGEAEDAGSSATQERRARAGNDPVVA